MKDPRRRDSIARSATRPALVALFACACAGAGAEPRVVASSPQSLAAVLRAQPSRAPDGALVVQLGFDASADLDLYVTDPLHETVYFANTPARSGGALDRDRSCGDAAPRVETIVFAKPLPGRYRIGVDHPKPCGDARDAAFALRVVHGERVVERSGALSPRRFEPIVLEFAIE